MKITRLLVASVLFLFTGNNMLIAQMHIGEDMLNWVKAELPVVSLKFIKADYKDRINNHFISIQQDSYYILDSFMTQVDSFLYQINNAEKRYRDMNPLKAAVERQKSADSVLQFARAVTSEVTLTIKELKGVGIVGSREFYVSKGIYHIGRTNLLESLLPSLGSIKDDLPKRYGFALEISVDQSGNASYQRSNSENVSQYEIAAETAVFAYGCQYPPYGPVIASAAIICYNLFKSTSDYDVWREQEKKMEEAMALFPSQLPSEETSYKLYTDQYKLSLDSFQHVNDSLADALTNVAATLKTLFAYSYARLKLSEEVLTNEKIQALKIAYSNNEPASVEIFNPSLLVRQFSDITLMTREKDSLRQEAAASHRDLSGFQKFENYRDAVKEYYATLRVLYSNYQYIPMWDYLNEKLAMEKRDSSSIAQIRQTIFKNNRPIVTTPLSDFNQFIKKEIQQNRKWLSAKLSPSNVNVIAFASAITINGNQEKGDKDPPKRHFTYLGEDGGKITLCYNCTTIYNMPAGGLGHRDLFNSSYDGAYQQSVTVAEREVEGMKNNIQQRIQALEKRSEELDKTLSIWRRENLSNLSLYTQKLQNQTIPKLNTSYREYFDNNEALLSQSRQSFDKFVSSSLNKESISQMEMNVRMAHAIKDEVKPENIRPEGRQVTGVEIRETEDGNYTPHSAQIRHERLKSQAEFKLVEERVKKNQKDGKKDPVFDQIQVFYDAERRASTALTNAERCLSKTNPLYLSNEKLAKELCANYVLQAKKLRAYSLGYLPGYSLPEKYFMPREALYKELRPNLDKFASCNIENKKDLEHSACNRYVGLAIRDAYGFNDFVNQPNSSDEGQNGTSFLNTSDLNRLMTTSENWHFVGFANQQDAIYNAAFYAAQGNAVIALSDDHVTLVLPSDLIFSPSWKMRVPKTVQFALSHQDGNPIFEYDVPLSKQWRPEAAPRVKFFYRDLAK
jgi:hypothetical protein